MNTALSKRPGGPIELSASAMSPIPARLHPSRVGTVYPDTHSEEGTMRTDTTAATARPAAEPTLEPSGETNRATAALSRLLLLFSPGGLLRTQPEASLLRHTGTESGTCGCRA